VTRRRVFAVLLGTSAGALVAEGVVNVSLMPYAASLGVPAAGLGLLYTAHRLVRLAAAPWAGLAADRVGRRPPLLLGFFCMSLALLVLALAGSFPTLLASRVLYGLGSACLITAGLASALDLGGETERGRTIGLYQGAIYGVYPLGSVAGGFLTDAFGYGRTFLGCSGAVLGVTLLATAAVAETGMPGPGGDRAVPGARLRDYPRLLDRRIRRYTALKMLSGFAIWGVFEATFVLFLLAQLGPETTLFGAGVGTRSVAGLMFGILLVLGFLLGSPVVGRWCDRTDQRMPLVWVSLAVTALALLVLGVAGTTETVTVAVVGLGLAVALATTPLAALVGDAARPERRAATLAAYSTLGDVANAVGSILGTALALGVGFRPTYIGTAMVVVAGSALLFPRTERRRVGDEPRS
jgi:MFS family permease